MLLAHALRVIKLFVYPNPNANPQVSTLFKEYDDNGDGELSLEA